MIINQNKFKKEFILAKIKRNLLLIAHLGDCIQIPFLLGSFLNEHDFLLETALS